MTIDTQQFLSGKQLLEKLFPEDCRPSMRWLDYQRKRRVIPYFKIGHLVFFDEKKVREKLEAKNFVRAV